MAKIEVKFDVVMGKTGNLAVELWQDKAKTVPGWGQYCEADILIQFYDMDNTIVLDWKKFKKCFFKNLLRFEPKESKSSGAEVIPVPVNMIPASLKIPDIGGLFSLDYGLEQWEIALISGQRLMIEPAKRGSSLCHICKKRIPKGALRIGTSKHWYDIECAKKETLLSYRSLESLSGFCDLTEEQKNEVKRILDEQG